MWFWLISVVKQKHNISVQRLLFYLYKVNTECLLSSWWDVLNSRNFRGHLPPQGSVSGLVCLLPLSCPPLSIPWPLPPAFEAGRPSLLLPDRIPHILWETGRNPAPCPRHKICTPAASSNRFALLADFQKNKNVTLAQKQWTHFIRLKQNVLVPRNVNTKTRSKLALGCAPQICEDLNSWHQFAWSSFGRARPCFSEHRPDLHLMQMQS